MSRTAELREISRFYLDRSSRETSTHLKRALASHAYALAQLAEKIERDEGGK